MRNSKRNTLLLGTILLVILSFTSCSVGPDYKKPKIATPKSWLKKRKKENSRQEKKQKESLSSLKEYWLLFDDSTLNSLLERSQINNLSLQTALSRIEQSYAILGGANADFFPQLQLSINGARRRRSQNVASPISGAENDIGSISLGMGWEIDVLGRLRRLSESATAQLESTIEDYNNTQVLIYSQVSSLYMQLKGLEASIIIASDNIKNQIESKQIAVDLEKAGLVPSLDVQQAKMNVSETKSLLPDLKQQAVVTKNALSVLLGMMPEEFSNFLNKNYSITKYKKDIPTIKKFSVKKLPLDILRQRPDLRRAERMLASENALIGAIKAEYFPIISLPGFISLQSLDRIERVFRPESLAYSIGPSIDWNIFTAGNISNRVKAQKSRTEQSLLQYKQVVLEAISDVENSISSIYQEKIKLRHLKSALRANEKAVSLVRTLYQSGLTDFQNVLDNERKLLSLQLSVANSKVELSQNYIALYRALGGGWIREIAY